MKITTILFFSVLCFMGVSAQTTHTTASQEGDNNFTGTNTHTGPETFSAITATGPVSVGGTLGTPSVTGHIYMDGSKYPLTATGLQNAITDSNGGIVYVPCGSTVSAGITTINVTVGVTIQGCNPRNSIINYTGSGTLFNVSANVLFNLYDTEITGTANPTVSVANGGASGQSYRFVNDYINAAAGIQVGNSAPYVVVDQVQFRCTQYDVNLGSSTDAVIAWSTFDSSGISSAQGHILLQAGAANVHVTRNTINGTNTTVPDITVFLVGGVNVGNIHIDSNKLGSEVIGAASQRILLSYSGAGTATFRESSISGNFAANGALIADFVTLSSNSISLIDDHFDDNVISAAPNTGYVVHTLASPPGGQAQNTAKGNSYVNGLFTDSVNDKTGFSSWTNTITGTQNTLTHVGSYEATVAGSATAPAFSFGTLTQTGFFAGASAGRINIANGAGGSTVGFGNGSVQLATGSIVAWSSSSTDPFAGNDTKIGRSSAGVVQISTGSGAGDGALKLGAIVSGGTAAALTGTGACATLSTQTGGALAGRATCTGTTGASTLTITPGLTATNGWVCFVQDQTTRANLFQQTATVAASCTLTATSVTQNDVFVFSVIAF